MVPTCRRCVYFSQNILPAALANPPARNVYVCDFFFLYIVLMNRDAVMALWPVAVKTQKDEKLSIKRKSIPFVIKF